MNSESLLSTPIGNEGYMLKNMSSKEVLIRTLHSKFLTASCFGKHRELECFFFLLINFGLIEGILAADYESKACII